MPKPVGHILQDVVFDGTRFVGVGDLGVVLTSVTGTNWHVAHTDVTNRLFKVFAGGERLFATGDGLMDTYIISTNAAIWAAGPGVFGSGGIGAIAYGLERYVMVAGYPHYFYVSSDTTGWEQLPYNLPHGVGDIAFGNEMFVAVGGKGLITTSTNGVEWVQRDSGTQGMLKGVAFGDGRWVAVGAEGATGVILTSEDGITWFLQVTDKQLEDVTFGPFGFIAVGGLPNGDGVSLNSRDGVYFTGDASGSKGLDSMANGAACGNGVCVAVGGNGRIWVTEDGINWVPQTTGPHAAIRGFASDGQRLVAVGAEGTLLVSEDGETFANRSAPLEEHFQDVIHTGSRYVAVGSFSVVRTSVDGWDWVREDTGMEAMYKVAAHGQGRTVVVGSDRLGNSHGLFAVREESGQWQIIRPAEYDYIFTQIAFGNGRFVAAGYDGFTWVSGDGLQWEKRATGASQTLQPLQFINDRFIAFTRNEVGFSDDGLSWTFQPGNPPLTRRLAYGNGRYLAAASVLQVSDNAVHWEPVLVKSLGFQSAYYFRDAFYLSGFILKSASSLVPEITQFGRGDGELNFHLFGRIGRAYELQSSPNLTDWAHEQDYTQSARQHPLTLPTGPDQRFYRVKLKE